MQEIARREDGSITPRRALLLVSLVSPNSPGSAHCIAGTRREMPEHFSEISLAAIYEER